MRVQESDGAAERMPIDPTLAEAIAAVSEAGHWATAFDNQWRIVAETAEQAAVSSGKLINDAFHFGPEALDVDSATDAGLDQNRETARRFGGWMLADLAVDREGLREMLHPSLRDLVDELETCDSVATGWATPMLYLGDKIGVTQVALSSARYERSRRPRTVLISKPGPGMNTIAMLTAAGDLNHFQHMLGLAGAGRRPAAVLFADLEGSAQLSKRMPTAAYFTLVRRITRAADQCVIDEGGLVGRHIGDGVAAFFVAETAESESGAARACMPRRERCKLRCCRSLSSTTCPPRM